MIRVTVLETAYDAGLVATRETYRAVVMTPAEGRRYVAALGELVAALEARGLGDGPDAVRYRALAQELAEAPRYGDRNPTLRIELVDHRGLGSRYGGGPVIDAGVFEEIHAGARGYLGPSLGARIGLALLFTGMVTASVLAWRSKV